MTTQLLIYERAVPVNSGRHVDLSVKAGDDYSFARQVNSLPLLAVEFPRAASEYAIVFAGAGLKPTVVDRRVLTVDIAATLAAYLGIKPPSGAVGNPLEEVVEN